MRVLSVRQPWAWAIIHGGKDVENRSRNIAGSYRGPVAIHAGLKADMDALTTHDMVGRIATTRLFSPPAKWFSNSPSGHIIGVVDLVDVHRDVGPGPYDSHDWVCCGSAWAESGYHHLELANPRPIEPIAAKGRLGLWRPDAELLARINDALTGGPQ